MVEALAGYICTGSALTEPDKEAVMSVRMFPLLFSLVLILLLNLGSLSGSAADFAAELAISTPDMNDTMNIYVKGYTYRLENSNDDGPLVLIRKRGTTWALEPGSDRFRELDEKEEGLLNPVAAWENLSYQMRGQVVGMDTVGGFECEIFGYNRKDDSAVVFRRWYCSELNFIIKQELVIEDSIGHMDIGDIVVGDLDEALFEVSPLSPPSDIEDLMVE